MRTDISQRTLLVVSDTPVCKTAGGMKVYEPVLRELKVLLNVFDRIIWLTSKVEEGKYVLVDCKEPCIEVVTLPSVHHRNLNWAYCILNYPAFLFAISKYIGKVNYVHTRGPSHPAFITILISKFDTSRKYWHKYAGNWQENNSPVMYRLQKQLLSKSMANAKVTVNGETGNNGNILSFENPCFTELELKDASNVADTKRFDESLSILFVGNLYKTKGVLELLEALQGMKYSGNRITTCYIIGDGPLKENVFLYADSIKHIKVHVIGTLNRRELNEYYKKSHFLVLPSRSEGFPKVVAEASSFGCIPVVTNVGAIGKYIQHKMNGYLLEDNSSDSIQRALIELQSNEDLKSISRNCTGMCSKFTYEYYVNRVKNEIFNIS